MILVEPDSEVDLLLSENKDKIILSSDQPCLLQDENHIF